MLPTTNISTTLVANTLGTSSRDVGTLCTSDRINKWSKYKPIDDDRNILPEEDWWTGTDGKCGLNINPVQIELGDANWTVRAIWESYNSNPWQYIKASKAFRLGDFRGYQHDAICPFQINYKKGDSYEVPLQPVGSVIFGYHLFDMIVDDFNDLPDGNLVIDDFPLDIYDGGTFYFRDAKLGVVVIRGRYDLDSNPEDINITATSDWLVLSDQTISESLGNSISVEIPVTTFMNVGGTNYQQHEYTLVGGMFFGPNYNRFVPIPMDDDQYPIRHITFAQRSGPGFSTEITQWSRELFKPVWHNVKWVYTEDMVAIMPVITNDLQIKLNAYYLNDPDITEPITLTTNNLRVVVSGDNGFSRDGYYGTFINANGQSISVEIQPNQEDPTEVMIDLGDAIPRYNDEGYEFHVSLFYTYGGAQQRSIFSMDFRVTENYQ